MYELAKTIQDERRRQASSHRFTSSFNAHKERTVTVGKYRLTVSRSANRQDRLA